MIARMTIIGVLSLFYKVAGAPSTTCPVVSTCKSIQSTHEASFSEVDWEPILPQVVAWHTSRNAPKGLAQPQAAHGYQH